MKAKRGTYLLLVYLEQETEIKVGSLGRVKFLPGYYIYAGKHRVNLEKRLERHFSGKKRVRWHVDYLTTEVQPLCAYYFPEDAECRLATLLASQLSGIKGFGSSDCKCVSHLFYSPSNPKNLIVALQPEGVFIPASALYPDLGLNSLNHQTQKKLIYYPVRGDFREVIE